MENWGTVDWSLTISSMRDLAQTRKLLCFVVVLDRESDSRGDVRSPFDEHNRTRVGSGNCPWDAVELVREVGTVASGRMLFAKGETPSVRNDEGRARRVMVVRRDLAWH